MAAESTEDEVVDDSKEKVEMSAHNNNACRSEWVSFEEKCEVPLLPQPPSQGDNMNSEKYIDRLGIKIFLKECVNVCPCSTAEYCGHSFTECRVNKCCMQYTSFYFIQQSDTLNL